MTSASSLLSGSVMLRNVPLTSLNVSASRTAVLLRPIPVLYPLISLFLEDISSPIVSYGSTGEIEHGSILEDKVYELKSRA